MKSQNAFLNSVLPFNDLKKCKHFNSNILPYLVINLLIVDKYGFKKFNN